MNKNYKLTKDYLEKQASFESAEANIKNNKQQILDEQASRKGKLKQKAIDLKYMYDNDTEKADIKREQKLGKSRAKMDKRIAKYSDRVYKKAVRQVLLTADPDEINEMKVLSTAKLKDANAQVDFYKAKAKAYRTINKSRQRAWDVQKGGFSIAGAVGLGALGTAIVAHALTGEVIDTNAMIELGATAGISSAVGGVLGNLSRSTSANNKMHNAVLEFYQKRQVKAQETLEAICSVVSNYVEPSEFLSKGQMKRYNQMMGIGKEDGKELVQEELSQPIQLNEIQKDDSKAEEKDTFLTDIKEISALDFSKDIENNGQVDEFGCVTLGTEVADSEMGE